MNDPSEKLLELEDGPYLLQDNYDTGYSLFNPPSRVESRENIQYYYRF